MPDKSKQMNPTDEELNVMVAEALGWIDFNTYEGQATGVPFAGARNPKTRRIEPIPDYAHDLNAAMGLAAELLREGWHYVFMDWNGQNQVTIYRSKNGIVNGEHYEATKPTLARAICVAWMKVKEGK